MANKEITPELLRRLIDYKPDTGEMQWRMRTAEDFPKVKTARGGAECVARTWNAKHAGKPVPLYKNALKGYCFQVNSRTVNSMRGVYMLANGVEPDLAYPKDGNYLNFEKSNIISKPKHTVRRDAATLNRNNTSGVRGVSWDKNSNRWRAVLVLGSHRRKNYKYIHLGLYAKFESAVAARRRAEIHYGFNREGEA